MPDELRHRTLQGAAPCPCVQIYDNRALLSPCEQSLNNQNQFCSDFRLVRHFGEKCFSDFVNFAQICGSNFGIRGAKDSADMP